MCTCRKCPAVRSFFFLLRKKLKVFNSLNFLKSTITFFVFVVTLAYFMSTVISSIKHMYASCLFFSGLSLFLYTVYVPLDRVILMSKQDYWVNWFHVWSHRLNFN